MRRIQAPGVEINEIDRSQYNVDNEDSLTDTTVFVTGFADSGLDYATVQIRNIQQFIQTYGYPTNEAERYFYYAAKETLDRRGNLYCSRLPYKNNVSDKLAYTTYKVGDKLNYISSVYDIATKPLPNLMSEPGYAQTVKDNENCLLSVLQMNQLEIGSKIKLKELLTDDYGNYTFEYQFIKDFLTYMFETAGVKYHTKGTYDKYFMSYDGIDLLRDLLIVAQSASEPDELSPSLVVERFGLINYHEYDELDDLYNIAKTYNNFYTSSDAIHEAFKMFIDTLTLDDFKHYYNNLKTIIDRIDNTEEDEGDKLGTLIGNTEQTHDASHDWLRWYRNLDKVVDEYVFNSSFSDIRRADSTISTYIEISSTDATERNAGLISMSDYDKLKVNEFNVPRNEIRIIDISRTKYQYNDDHDKQFLGIMPVVTTAANALMYQDIITNSTSLPQYNCLSRLQTVYSDNIKVDLSCPEYYNTNNKDYLFATPFESNISKAGVADIATSYFPEINFTASQRLDRNYMKQIGIVVFKLVRSVANSNRVQCVPVESFVGSLDKFATDFKKGTNVFIDNMVNEHSNYINVFTNVDFNKSNKKINNIADADIFIIKDQCATSIGFFDVDCFKEIQPKYSILDALDLIFKNNNNIDKRNIDLVLDAGVSTIAQYIASCKQLTESNTKLRTGAYDPVAYCGTYDPSAEDSTRFKIQSEKQTTVWRMVINKYDSFCKHTRKDCMFLADCLRSTCIAGEQKIVRRTKPSNTITDHIIPQLRYQLNINTSYGAGYCDWFYLLDEYSGLYFWCPPSIKAAGIYIYTDIYFNYWDAPAGLNRGVIRDAYDVAFNPTNDEAGKIYKQSWNYAVNYPLDGIVLEGQRTFQINQTAFDRVNVRRMFLRMEKLVYRIAKRFCYEGNTPYLRQRFVDTITPIFDDAQNGGGISQYLIICNDTNNTIKNIENHELHCTIAIRPIKSIEFIVMNFIAMPQSGSFSEEEILSMTPYANKE